MNKASDIRLNHNGLMPTIVRVWEEYQGLLRFALAGIHDFSSQYFSSGSDPVERRHGPGTVTGSCGSKAAAVAWE